MEQNDIDRLILFRHRLLAYARHKTGDPELAEDVLQESMLKALRSAPKLRDKDRVLAWFYRILNNTIIDHYRSGGRQTTLLAELADEGPDSSLEAELCACLVELLPSLRPSDAALIEQLELSDGDADTIAKQLGISRSTLKVRRHRARQALRRRLEETCRVCATHGCLDCSCKRQ
jgi:RNA polymerase sigma factor (sigma-70 family)